MILALFVIIFADALRFRRRLFSLSSHDMSYFL